MKEALNYRSIPDKAFPGNVKSDPGILVHVFYNGEKLFKFQLKKPGVLAYFNTAALFLAVLITAGLSGNIRSSDSVASASEKNIKINGSILIRDEINGLEKLNEQQHRLNRLISHTVPERETETLNETLKQMKGASVHELVNERYEKARQIVNKNLEYAALYSSVMRELPHRWPLQRSSLTVTSSYGMRRGPFGSVSEFHRGLDLRAYRGENVIAAADGVVIAAGRFGGYGNMVRIAHSSGYETLYAHLDSVAVKKNQIITSGTVIGYTGNTGHSTGPHLHYEILKNGVAFDPLDFLAI